MCKVEFKVKGDKVMISTRISKGYDENGKRIRERFHLEVNQSDYPDEESQLKAFDDYLVSIGESSLREVKENEDTIQAKKNDGTSKKIDMEHIKVNQTDEVSTRYISKIPLSNIRLNEFNPYTIDDEFIQRLANAIKEDGLNNPIHVVMRDGEYVVNKGNKRYLAYQLLEKEFGEEYGEIECYIMETVENSNLEILQLLRDNDNTYERTLIDKVKETELYHQIYPSLKDDNKIEKGLRENEWIGKEMGLADKSIKDYLKIIKNEQIKDMFYLKKIDTLNVALQLCDFYKEHGDRWFNRLLEIYKQRYSYDNDVVSDFGLSSTIWNVEYEIREEKEKEEKENQQLIQNSEPVDSEQDDVEKIEEEEKEAPCVINVDELGKCCLIITEIKDMNFEYDIENYDCEVEFTYTDDYTKQEMYFNLNFWRDCVNLIIANKSGENDWTEYDRMNKVIDLRISNVNNKEFYTMKEYLVLLTKFTEEKSKYEITEKKNFVYDLLPKALKERLSQK